MSETHLTLFTNIYSRHDLFLDFQEVAVTGQKVAQTSRLQMSISDLFFSGPLQ